MGVTFTLLPPQEGYVAVEKDGYIKWVDFNVTYKALSECLEYDIETYGGENHASWIDLLAVLASRLGGSFKNYKSSDLSKITDEIKGGKSVQELSESLKSYPYYKEAYEGVLSGFVGEYEIERDDGTFEKKYGLKAFSPIAKGYSYSHFDDFGASRSYGFKRKHLGHDMMGSVGTPVIAVESGYVECVGWNQYGGWRIGIRSFDKKRYYYYAHLRRDHPYNDMYEGKIVTAGDVIGYLGMTGYSTKENVNNINTPHLHWGMQLIFDESQKDALAEIWIDVYAITRLLEKNRSAVEKVEKEYERKYEMFELGYRAE
ncbi:MAG: M23 family metallopeptidase [Clostridia bacterium]|nr:M23 family metallopeptidase [Clostridia bacterium]